jgi:hypothetical protein
MAYRVQRISPVDLQPRKAVGVSVPFSGGAVFNSTYQTKDALRSNLINFFLTGKNERVLNLNIGSGLRDFIFEAITEDSIDIAKEKIRRDLENYFPTLQVNELVLESYVDQNLISFKLAYSIRETNITDEVSINFEQ